MALTHFGFELIKRVLDSIPSRPLEMATMGYPDCLISTDKMITLFGPHTVDGLSYREDSAQIAKWHNLTEQCPQIPETVNLFQKLGVTLTVFDIEEIRGGELICDLNQPIARDLENRFDIVLDAGTMEHCFNVGQVVTNLLAMTRQDGVILHLNPCYVINHGFFNFSPTFYHDFYADNGHHLMMPMTGFVNRGLEYEAFNLPSFKRVKSVPEQTWIAAAIQKKNDQAPVWPTQTKYKKA